MLIKTKDEDNILTHTHTHTYTHTRKHNLTADTRFN